MTRNTVYGEAYAYAPQTGGGEGNLPAETDVRLGVNFGTGRTGVLELPVPSTVLVGIGYGAYGAEFEGTLRDAPGGSVGPPALPVLLSGALRDPLYSGESYTAETGQPFIWNVPAADVPTGAAPRFYGYPQDCCNGENAWSVEGTLTTVDGVTAITFDLTSEQTAAITPGPYDWRVTLDDGVEIMVVISSVTHGLAYWVCL